MSADSDVFPEHLSFSAEAKLEPVNIVCWWSTIPPAIHLAQNGLSVQSNPLYNLILPL